MRRVSIALLGAATGIALGDPMTLDVFTDFEDIIPNTPIGGTFDVGDATFSGVGNFAGVVGEGELYHSGIRAWMVQGEGIGRVDFASGASIVEFWAIVDPEATLDAFVTAFDTDGNIVGLTEPIGVGQEFRLISFTGDISYILFDHSGADNEPTGMLSIDDFGYTPVPSPGVASTLLLGGLLGTRRRRA